MKLKDEVKSRGSVRTCYVLYVSGWPGWEFLITDALITKALMCIFIHFYVLYDLLAPGHGRTMYAIARHRTLICGIA